MSEVSGPGDSGLPATEREAPQTSPPLPPTNKQTDIHAENQVTTRAGFFGPQNVRQKCCPWTVLWVHLDGDVSPGWQSDWTGILAKVWEPILSSYWAQAAPHPSPVNMLWTFWPHTVLLFRSWTFPEIIFCIGEFYDIYCEFLKSGIIFFGIYQNRNGRYKRIDTNS